MAKKGRRSRSKRKGKASITAERMSDTGSNHVGLETILGKTSSKRKKRTMAIDNDGTLSEWEGAAAKTLTEVGAQYGLEPVSKRQVQNIYRRAGPKRAFRMMGLSESQAVEAVKKYENTFQNHLGEYTAKPGATRLIYTNKKAGIKNWVITNGDKKYAEPGLDAVAREYNQKYGTRLSKESLFDGITYSAGKPKSNALVKAKKSTGAEYLIMVGDEIDDMRSAHSADEETGNVFSWGELETQHTSAEFGRTKPDRLSPDTAAMASSIDRYIESTTIPDNYKPGQQANQLFISSNQGGNKPGESPGYHATQLSSSWRDAA